MRIELPNYVTHYHLPDKEPFLNLSDLPPDSLALVLADLNQRRAADPSFKRVFGRRYMQLRSLTERKLRSLFVMVGGKPERQAPHYFVLGPSQWFKALCPEMREFTVPLSALPSEVTSFTYPDSFTSMALGPQFGLPHVPRPYHEQVFRIEQLPAIVQEFGLPADDPTDHEGYHLKPFEKYIEVQLWSNSSILSLPK